MVEGVVSEPESNTDARGFTSQQLDGSVRYRNAGPVVDEVEFQSPQGGKRQLLSSHLVVGDCPRR